MTSAGLTLLIVLATLAFGAVYPWGYLPLFSAAAAFGLAGLIRDRSVPPATRPIAVGITLVGLAILAQLVPVSRGLLDTLSPHAAPVMADYSLTFTAGNDAVPLSIRPEATAVALLGLAGLGLYVVGLPALLSRHDLRTLPRNLIAFAVPLALLGIYGREHNNGLVYGFWQPEQGTNANGFGPFVNRNHFAGWMLMATCLSVGVLCGRLEGARSGIRSTWRQRIVWLSGVDANRLILLAVSIAVMAVSLVWTMSRSGIVSFMGAMVMFAWAVARRQKVGRTKRLLAIAALSVLLVGSVAWRGIDPVVRWFSDTADFSSRLLAWQDGWQVARDFFLTGTGINTYPDVMLFYQRHVMQFWMTHAHNDYLQLLAEGGLLVTVPAAALVVMVGVTIRRRLREAAGSSYDYWTRLGATVGLLAMGIQESVEFSLHIPANALLFATLLVIAIAPIQSPAPSRQA